MSKKQKIIVSITGIVLVSLILIGLTYAYFLTKITGNTNEKSISVSTANLEIKYEDNNDVITGDKIEPGVTLPSKTFIVTNNGNSNVDYSVGLVNIINTFTNTKDVVYNVTCTSYKKSGFKLNTDGTVTGTVSGTCSGVDETEFPTLNSYIVNNNIDVNIVHAYTITVTYKETGTDQSIDMNKELSAKIDIFDPKSLTIKGNVTNSSENDYVVIHSKEQESNIINGKYQFIGITPDNHTISIKNRDTTTSKDTTLNVSKGTPSVSSSSIVYDNEKNIADMDINVSSNTITLDVGKISDGTLRETILASAETGGANRTVMGTTVTEFTSISGENERVLNNAPDDYGTSYYYRGNVLDNYVSFANKLWKIVRINGNGSIRLVLDDVAKDSSGKEIDTAFNEETLYGNISNNNKNANIEFLPSNNLNNYEIKYIAPDFTECSVCDNAYIGYMYGTPGSTTYDDTHKNINDSTIKTQVDAWYKNNIVDTNNADYVADTLFCNDKTLASSSIGDTNTALGYGTNKTYYASTERLQYSTGTTDITTSKPTFKCAESATNDYSRFTVNVNTLPNGNKTNGNLTYPVGLLTADEVAYAGAYKYGKINTTYYLYNSSISPSWWLSSPNDFYGLYAYEWYVNYSSGHLYSNHVDSSYAFRPSINLKAETLKNTGDGTKENPYTVLIN